MVEVQTPSFCPKCGKGIASDDRFCRSCGFDLASLQAEADPSGWGDQPTWRTVAPQSPPAVTSADPFAAMPAPTVPAADVTERRSRTPFVVGLLLVGAIAVGAFALASGTIQTPLNTHEVSGTFALSDSSGGLDTSGVGCKGDGGYGDIGPGTNITVKDEKGTLLDTASLGQGTGSTTSCTFTFALTVPDSAKFYTFETGSRGEISFSHDDMVGQGWTVGITLGD